MNIVRLHRIDDEETFPLVAGIPIPHRKHKAESKLGRTMRKMKVGQSFIVKHLSKGVSGPHRAASRAGIKIVIRRMDDGFIRIWRIA
jgi:hypothetical protein